MRIGLITGEYPPMQGGIADYTAILARELVTLGHKVHILTSVGAHSGAPHPSPPIIYPIVTNWTRAALGGQIRRWAAEHSLELINLQYQTAAFQMSGAIHFLPQILSVGAQYIAPLRTPSLFTGLWAKPKPKAIWRGRGEVAFVTTFHDLRFPYLFPKVGPIRPWIVRHLARQSDGCIVTNRGDQARLAKEVAPHHLAQIPLGSTVQVIPATDPHRAKAIRQALGAADGDLVIVHFGFVNAVKGVDTLIQAVTLTQQMGIKIHLLMLGERLGASDPTNAAYSAEIEALAASLNVSLHWTGFLRDDQLGDYFAAADAVALPFKDGASLRRTSLQAALAYGCAAITTHPTDDPLPEFKEGEHLCYVPPNDPQALADAFAQLQHKPELKAKLQNGAKQAASQFQWDHIAKQVIEFYQHVIS